MAFTCSVCGERHAEELRDVRLGLPDDIHALGADERSARAWLADDFAVLDDDWFYVRGLLEIPIPEEADRFAYGTWVEVPIRSFKKLMERWHEPSQFKPMWCRLANELAPYENTLMLQAVLRPVSPSQLPRVDLEDSDHPLVRDQRNGISVARARGLASVVTHRV